MSTELYRKHRPQTFKAVVGQESAVSMLKEMVNNDRVPHALLFTGESGCGKTTLARIMKTKLECGDIDYHEINCADFNGIEMVRDIRNRMGLSPIGGRCRIWYIDEAHQLTAAAQNAFLKMLEDTPAHVYFFLATTNPTKLLTTIRTRCTEVKLKALSPDAMKQLLSVTAEKEGFALDADVADKIVEHAEGSARKALVLLNQVVGIESVEEQKNTIENSDHASKAVELARALMAPGCAWSDIVPILKTVEEEPESLRRMVLGYAANVMLGSSKLVPRAFVLIDVFQNPFYDSGKAGLVAACYAVSRAK